MEYRDFTGQKIMIGDVIAYPVRRGSSMTLKEATVSEQPGSGCTVKKGVVCLSPSGRRVIIETPERCVVFSNFKDRRSRGK
jgi:hypothetical protein